ncbi:MAG: flippase-like domain-containing protein [Actinomycetia bacterium]|nr:flippase-like domain-containing protein [Actinomycetes bacterium]
MSHYFANEPDQPRVRRARDAVALGLGLVLLVWAAANVDRVAAVEAAIVDLAQSIPLWFDEIYRLAYFGGLVLLLVLVIGILAQGSKRLDLLRDVVLAVLASIGIAAFLVWFLDGSFPVIFPEFIDSDVEFAFPIMRVAVLTSAITVASPNLVRPVRRFAWLMIFLVATSGLGLGLGLPGDAGGGFALGLVAGASILLIFGSPSGYPSPTAVMAAMSGLGVSLADVEPTLDGSWGIRRMVGRLNDGTEADIKAYGRDATDSQYLARVWRGLWFRESGQTYSGSRVQAVEHEALAVLSAKSLGVPTQKLLAVGVAGDDMALIAMSGRGEAVSDIDVSEDVLVDVWRAVARLHAAGMAHGALTLEAVRFEHGKLIVTDLGGASLSAPPVRQSIDVVNLLFSTSVKVGAEDAVVAARTGLGDEALIAALPFMQTAALLRQQRSAVDKPKKIVADIRDRIAEATDVELPEEAKLRRVRPKDLIMPALSLIAAYALLNMLTDIDFVAVWAVVQDASWALIILGFVIGQTSFLPEATGMLFATGYDLPLKPLTILQVSVKWIGLAVPSAAGRVTMNTLFLRKYGITPAIALTQGILDGIAGFVVEAGILILAFLVADTTFNLTSGDVRLGLIFAIVVALIGVSVFVIVRVEKVRTVVLPALKDAWGLLWSLLKNPTRTFGLLGSNLASRTILAITMWFILQAIGAPLPLVTTLVATVATNLLAGLVPIPGGIGVAEAVLTSLLVFAGLGTDEAFAAAVVFRIATFYLPAAEGFFAMKWLEANDHL